MARHGRLAINAINARDYPVMMALFVISSFLGIVGVLMVDILYSVVDPRVRYDRSVGVTMAARHATPSHTDQHPSRSRKSSKQTYWGAVGSKLYHDKITLFAIVLLIFMVGISVGAPLDRRPHPRLRPHRHRSAHPQQTAHLGQPKPGPSFRNFTRTCNQR